MIVLAIAVAAATPNPFDQSGESSQLEKFKAAARAAECDESEAAFKRALRAIAKAPVEKRVKAK